MGANDSGQFGDPDPRIRILASTLSGSLAAHIAATDPHGDRAAAAAADAAAISAHNAATDPHGDRAAAAAADSASMSAHNAATDPHGDRAAAAAAASAADAAAIAAHNAATDPHGDRAYAAGLTPAAPSGTGYPHVTSGATDGASKTPTQVTADLNNFVADTGAVVGLKGLVPAPAIGDLALGRVLSVNGWIDPPGILAVRRGFILFALGVELASEFTKAPHVFASVLIP